MISMASMDVPYQRILTFVLRSFHRRTAVFYVPYCQYAYSILVSYKFCPEGFMLFTRHVVKFFYGDKLVVDGQSTPYAIFYKGNGLILTENDLIKYGLGKQIIPAYAQKTQFVVLPIPIGGDL